MTCVAGLELADGTVMLAADSAISHGDSSVSAPSTRKLLRRSGIVMGMAGDVADMGLIKRQLDLPHYDGSNPIKWAHQHLVPAIKAAIYAEDDKRDDWDLDLLVGIGGTLIVVDTWCTVHDHGMKLAAIGSGAEVALGSMFEGKGSPKAILTRALRAAHAFKSGVVKPPWRYIRG